METKDIKSGLRKRIKVKYKNCDYYFIACRFRFDKKKNDFVYDIELKSTNANSVTIARMSDVELIEED